MKLRIALNSAIRIGHPPEIALQATAEYHLHKIWRCIVDQPIRFEMGVVAYGDHVLNLGTVDGDYALVCIAQFDIASVDVKLAR